VNIEANNNIITISIPVFKWDITLELNINEMLGR
jgi:hypothetical protein